jgi:hypothetical protein
MAELSPTPDGPHGPGCNGIGKFDCSFDEEIYADLDDIEGDAEAPTGWWQKIDLDITFETNQDTADRRLSEHYGWSEHLIIGGNSQGFVKVVAFEDSEKRQVMLDLLETQFNEWYDGDGDQL